jgi:hypothetical protein
MRRLELDKDDGDLEDRRNRMTTPRAALHVASESGASAGGKLSDLSRDQDPLRRLEAELQSAEGGRPDVERLYEQAWTLLEEAWSLMTECLVMRDGLLDACAEIEQTMDAVHRRLGALPTPVAPNARERPAAGGRDTVHGFDGAVAS